MGGGGGGTDAPRQFGKGEDGGRETVLCLAGSVARRSSLFEDVPGVIEEAEGS